MTHPVTLSFSVRDLILTVVLLVVTILGCSLGGGAATPEPADGELASINALIDEFQSAYSAKDMPRLRATFHTKANVAIDFNNSTVQSSYRIDEWIPATQELLKNKRSVSDILSNREITVYRNIATVVADYNYRADGEHQAGQDIMIVTKLGGSWKIFSLTFYGDVVK